MYSSNDSRLQTRDSQLINPADSRLQTQDSRLNTALPFLGFTQVGTAPESDLIRDYEREHQQDERREQTRLKKLRSPRNVVDMFLSPEYKRYLER